ncbi:Transmembrane protein [Actinidia chinensis var. chinensis]|uniref:Transmembrane protein n=1 Tax=Actinidia chinensis var. chinensis TaxID=1590841 RepID=A0A2R6PPL4_ACTCC|nr:Transmembrane protein [Actinidia chinensis var. chinensis]
MVGLIFSSGLVAMTDYVSPGKEFHWLMSAFAGIAMCKIVFELTDIVSPFFFKEYPKLSDAEKLEWSNRGFSTFHALVVAVASLYLLLLSDLFDEDSHTELIIARRSTLSDTILGISIGYFLSDLAMIFWNFPALGGMEYVLHHGLSMFSIFLSLVSGQGLVYILMVLFTESTTPFVNLRWYLDIAGQKNSKLYVCNGVALFFGWLVARILLFIFFFYHIFTHFDQVKKLFPLGFYSLLAVPPVLTVMNLFWFWKISKGMMKTLSKARHRQ